MLDIGLGPKLAPTIQSKLWLADLALALALALASAASSQFANPRFLAFLASN
jgi:hypothetical protein